MQAYDQAAQRVQVRTGRFPAILARREFLAQDVLEREARVLALAAKVALDFRALLRATQRLDRQRDAALFRVDADDFGFDFVTFLVANSLFVFFSLKILTESLFVFLSSVFLLCLILATKKREKYFIVAGAILASAFLAL